MGWGSRSWQRRETMEGTWLYRRLDLDPVKLILGFCERINFCYFKIPTLWSFVIAAKGN